MKGLPTLKIDEKKEATELGYKLPRLPRAERSFGYFEINMG